MKNIERRWRIMAATGTLAGASIIGLLLDVPATAADCEHVANSFVEPDTTSETQLACGPFTVDPIRRRETSPSKNTNPSPSHRLLECHESPTPGGPPSPPPPAPSPPPPTPGAHSVDGVGASKTSPSKSSSLSPSYRLLECHESPVPGGPPSPPPTPGARSVATA
jgi:hypothetical protein